MSQPSQQPPSCLKDYQKPWESYEQQIQRLQGYGLIVNDLATAVKCLAHLNYYRFSGYCLAFEQSRHHLVPGTTFEQVWAAYEFDRLLRDLVTEALEAAEVEFRTAVAYHYGKNHGAFGHTSPAGFFHAFDHPQWLTKLHDETERSSELFVDHFRKTYRQYPDLPVWVAMELVSFGALSQMYSGMLKPDQKAICSRYGLQPADLGAWMHHFVYVRNLCAHHARLWDRVWAVKLTLPSAAAWRPPYLPGNDRLFATLLALNVILRRCPAVAAFTTEWRGRVEALLANVPAVPDALGKMGLTAHWQGHPLWR